MNYTSTFTFTSEYDPDISYEIRKPSYGRKIEFDRMTVDYRERARDIHKRYEAVQTEIETRANAWRFEQDRRIADVRIELQQASSDEDRARLRDQLDALEAQSFELDAALAEKRMLIEQDSLRLQASVWNPARVRWALAAIRGLAINGVPATPDTLLADGPVALVGEILDRITEVSDELDATQLKNCEPPTTSSAQAGGATSASTASSAEPSGSTENATAGA